MIRNYLFVAILSVVVLTGLTACNTAAGFGEDLENAGRSINKTFE